MDPSMLDVERAVPDKLVYAPKSVAEKATARRVTLSPFSGTKFGPSERVQVVIPVGSWGEVLDAENSYVQITVNNDHTEAIVLDGSIAACVEACEIYYGGRQIQRIANYGALHTALLDATASVDARSSTLFAMGCGAVQTIASARNGVSIPAGSKRGFTIGLLGLLGTGASRFIPVGAMKPELRLDLIFANSARRMFTSTTTFADSTVSFTSIKYQAQIIRLDSGAWDKLNMSLAKTGFAVPCMNWQTTIASIPQGQSIFSIPIAITKKSVSAVLVMFYDQASYSGAGDAHLNKCISARTRDSLREISLQAGSERYPQQPIDLTVEPYSEASVELARVFKAVNASSESSITSAEWISGAACMFGFSLDSFGSSSDIMRDGVDLSLASQLQLTGSFTAASAALTVVIAVLHDQLITVTENDLTLNE